MKYVIGVDLGTSSVKVLLVNQLGEVCQEAVRHYPLSHPKTGYSEQNPEEWVQGTIEAVNELVSKANVSNEAIEGISFSGQMHGLVLIDETGTPLRPAILWNDTRTTKQCQKITEVLGSKLLEITKNKALEGFTLPKILWVQEHEPELLAKATQFLLPKDYLRYRLTGNIDMEYSDAAGTLLLDIVKHRWSEEICETFAISPSICPPLIESHELSGTLLLEIANEMNLTDQVKVFAGGADNACGALGAGIINDEMAMCSIGTSGVFLAYEKDKTQDFKGALHFFNHSQPNSYYSMGVTLAAGYSLNWFKETFAKEKNFEELLEGIAEIPAGANGLVFTPYIVGERTPFADALIRGSFIGMDSTHTLDHFTRAVIEGITFSLRDSLELMRTVGKKEVGKIVSIGGGAKNHTWLQIQADIFNTPVTKLTSEQGPALGAAIIAAIGCQWFETFEDCKKAFIRYEKEFTSNPEQVKKYQEIYEIYTQIYDNTKSMNQALNRLR